MIYLRKAKTMKKILSLALAVLMLASHWFRNREPVASVAQNQVPYTVDYFVKPYRRLKDI